MSTVRATANILVTLKGKKVKKRFDALTRTTNKLALQEWPRRRNRMLRKKGRLIKGPIRKGRKIKPHLGWTFVRPRRGGGPIGFHNELHLTIVSCKAVQLVGWGRVDRVPGRRTLLSPSWATRVKTVDETGFVTIHYNIHFTAGVQIGQEGYRKDRPLRVARHKQERIALNELVLADLNKGYEVEVYGDTNFHHMEIAGLSAWWDVKSDQGTLGNRAIDGIWTSSDPDDVVLLPALTKNEHRHVITFEDAA